MSSLIEDRDINKFKMINNLTKIFISNCIKSEDRVESERVYSKILDIYQKIREISSKLYADEISLEGFRNINQNIEQFEIKEIRSIMDIQDLIANVQEETEKLEDYYSILMNDVISTCDKHQEIQIPSLFNSFFSTRNMKSL